MNLGPPFALSAALLGGAFALTPLREQLAPHDLAAAGRFVRVGAYTLHCTDEGPRDGPPVLLAHGFAAWAFTWRRLRVALAKMGYRVLTVDHLGAGASDRPAAPVYTTHTQAKLMLGARDVLGAVHIFDGMGHLPHEEAFEAVQGAIVSFLLK